MHVKPEGPFLVEEGQKLGGVKHGEVQVGLDLGEAADVPRGHEVRPRGLEVFRLPPSQGLGDLRLEEVVGPGGAAAELPLPGFQDLGPAAWRSLLGASLTPWAWARWQASW